MLLPPLPPFVIGESHRTRLLSYIKLSPKLGMKNSLVRAVSVHSTREMCDKWCTQGNGSSVGCKLKMGLNLVHTSLCCGLSWRLFHVRQFLYETARDVVFDPDSSINCVSMNKLPALSRIFISKRPWCSLYSAQLRASVGHQIQYS